MSQMEIQFTFGKTKSSDAARLTSAPASLTPAENDKIGSEKKQTESKEKKQTESRTESPRKHHKTTTLTTDRYTYQIVSNLREGVPYPVRAVNDIVSSCDPTTNLHFMRRRSKLVRSQYNGGFQKIKIRSDSANAIECVLNGIGNEPDDSCQFTVYVMRKSA